MEGGGFGWVNPPGRQALERYFRGLLLVPERELFVGRLDGTIVGSTQLVRPPRNNEAQSFAAQMMHLFIAPYARGHGVGEAGAALEFRVANRRTDGVRVGVPVSDDQYFAHFSEII